MFTDNATIGRNMIEQKRATRALQTPGDVLNYWFDDVATNPSKLEERNKLWWIKSDDTDRLIASRSVLLLARLASGLGLEWAKRGPAERLAAIVALDQFTRNIFRDTEFAFENDALALQLCKEGLAKGDDKVLAPIKRWFFYLPLMHSEDIDDQDKSVELFEKLIPEADDSLKEQLEGTLEFAIKHRDLIVKYGRYPHRNEALSRPSSEAELEYLSQPGAGF